MPGWLKFHLIIIVLPILVGGIVLFVAGRPVALSKSFNVVFRLVSRGEMDQYSRSRAMAGRHRPPQPLILDARTQPEFAVSHLRGAVAIDPYRPSLRPLRGIRPSEAIVVYSSAGYRGARVTSWLNRAGYTSVVNLSGGLFKWANEGRPMVQDESAHPPGAPLRPPLGALLDGRHRAEAAEVEKRSAGP